MTRIRSSINYIIVASLFIVVKGYDIVRQISLSYKKLWLYDVWYDMSRIDWWNKFMHENSFVLIFFAPLWIVLFSNYKLYSEFNNGLILYEIQRKKYRGVILKKILLVWIKAPIMLLSLSLFVIVIASFLPYIEWSSLNSDIQNPYVFFIMSNINSVMFCILAANVGLLVNYRFRKFTVSLLLTQLAFTALLITYILMGVVLDFVYEGYHFEDVFNLYGVMSTTDIRPALLLFISCLISIFVTLKVYLRKEKVVIAIEKSL